MNVNLPASPNGRGRVTSPFTRSADLLFVIFLSFSRLMIGQDLTLTARLVTFDSWSKPLLSDDSDFRRYTSQPQLRMNKEINNRYKITATQSLSARQETNRR
jgi:hypothetical protein